jgi:hypothetical protein
MRYTYAFPISVVVSDYVKHVRVDFSHKLIVLF